MSRRLRNSLLVALLLMAGFAVFVLVGKSPPLAARLLPESDGMVYANLKPVRLITHFDRKPVAHSAEYQQFIDATGIVFERDLDAVAFGLNRMTNPNGPNGPVAFSEVFVGHFDGQRLSKYLGSIATGRETYAGHEIFTIPIQIATGATQMVATGRSLRVTQLGSDTIAASNAPTPEQIHAILDRFRSGVGLFSGSSLLTGLYPEVPISSSIWGIGAIGLPFSEGGHVTLFGLHLPLADATPFVASLRYTTGLYLRVEQIAASEAEAARSVQRLTTLLDLLRRMHLLQGSSGNDAALRTLAESLKIERHQDRAVLTAEIPLDIIRSLVTSSPSVAASQRAKTRPERLYLSQARLPGVGNTHLSASRTLTQRQDPL
jgi:hypothetical protein